MIPLRLRAEAPTACTPFVVRLRGCHHANAGLCDDDAHFEGVTESRALAFRTSAGPLFLFDVPVSEVENDVLVVVPARGVAHRLIRAGSQHNSLLVTERCDQLCVMCSQPPKKHHVDQFAYFRRAVLLAPEGATIGITGGEPTLYKEQLFALLCDTMTSRPDLRFHVLTNGQHFDRTDAPALRDLRLHVLWGVPLYAADEATHDTIVGKAGAFHRLRGQLGLLATCGSEIELRTVVLQSNVEKLGDLARHLTVEVPFISVWAIMQLENIGFGRMNWSSLFCDTSLDFGPIGSAIDLARAKGLRTLLYNFPLCTVPPSYRPHALATISDWKRRYLQVCDGCRLREDCGGFFEWYPDKAGFRRIGVQ